MIIIFKYSFQNQIRLKFSFVNNFNYKNIYICPIVGWVQIRNHILYVFELELIDWKNIT